MDSYNNIQRFPPARDRSLKAWSAADEHILKKLEPNLQSQSSIAVINDRFGYLAVHLANYKPIIITHFKSQEDAINFNFALNNKPIAKLNVSRLLDEVKNKYDLITVKVPKSMDLFHLFVIKAHELSTSKSKVYCGFMTRHFTKQMLEIASQYFENVDQSLALKKSRVLVLSSPKIEATKLEPIKHINFTNHREVQIEFQQYFGVFSANHIDYATQFLLKHLVVDKSLKTALDLASGNGVIAQEIRSQSKDLEIHLLDDSHLAIESSKLNIKEGINHFHYEYNLDIFESEFFDLVVCNPPFHFEHENTIEIALNLFKGVSRILKSDGTFILVANLHLNYKTHLADLFRNVEVLNMNSKFEVIKCYN